VNELLFPVLGTAVIVLLVLPLCAAITKVLLVAMERVAGPKMLRFSAARYVLLALASFLPLGWSLSAALHQAETGRSVLACLVSHDLEELCVEPVLFAVLLTLAILIRSAPWLRTHSLALRPRGRRDGPEAQRVRDVVDRHRSLEPLTGRTLISDELIGGSATIGFFRPMVVLDASFVRRCSDEVLAGALGHELEHVRGRDPLRYFLLALAMRLNPAGEWLLRRHALSWTFGREVQCDRAAVLAGAEPFGVADALMHASRPPSHALAHMRGGDTSKLRLRVELLLAYAEKQPANDVRHGSSALALTVLLALMALAVPHRGATDPLDLLHTSVERLAGAALN
jgi:Zn-dependent protease with chaperone function